MAVSRTKERVFQRGKLCLAPQTAEGSPISDFSSGTGAMLWARRVRVNEMPQQETFQGSVGDIQERDQGIHNSFNRPEIEVEFYPTPLQIKEILKSFAGPFAGTAVTWPNGISTWYSFLYVEAEDGAAGFKAFRYEDAWVRELKIQSGNSRVAVCTAKVIAQNVTPLDTDAAGLTYDAAPPDFIQYAHKGVELIKDPSGTPVQLAASNIEVILRHGFDHDPFNTPNGFVTKQGGMEVTGTVTSRLMDETAALRADAVAATYRKFRWRMISGSNELRLEFSKVAWTNPTDEGFQDKRALDFNQNFRAGTSDPGSENVVDINVIT